MSIYSCGLGDDDLRLVVSPKTAMQMLDIGETQLYALLKAGELESYRDGKSRKIVVASIKARIRRKLDEAQANPGDHQPQPLPPQRRKRGAAASPLEETT